MTLDKTDGVVNGTLFLYGASSGKLARERLRKLWKSRPESVSAVKTRIPAQAGARTGPNYFFVFSFSFSFIFIAFSGPVQVCNPLPGHANPMLQAKSRAIQPLGT